VNLQDEDPADEVKRLQRCIGDLVSLLALPAVWSGNEPSHIVDTLLDALLRMLNLEFVFVRFKDPVDSGHLEIARIADSSRLRMPPKDIERALKNWFGSNKQNSYPAESNPLENEDISIFPVPLGIHGEIGMIVVGSDRADFPSQTESLLLSVAANQASIGLREAEFLKQQKRIADELDRRVTERTVELAKSNQELAKEITERKLAEEALRASEIKLRQVIDTIPTLAWCNLPEGPNEFLSKPWHDYTGLSPEESHGWGWQVALHPEDLPPLMKRWQELLISGEGDEMEARLRRHDGVYRWFLIRVQPLRDEMGKIVRWYGTSTDIEDRKVAEEQLAQNEAFLAEGQHLSRTGSFSWCLNSGAITWSEQMYRIFEFEQGTTVTLERIGSRIHPEDLPIFNDMVDRARENVGDFEYAHRLLMPDGSVKHLHLTAHGRRDPSGRMEYIGAVQDVTQRRASEEALGKARSELTRVARITSLGVLTASIAHEVNQPLSGIITNASTCLRMLSADPPNVDGACETARRTIRDGHRASDVITRLRTLYSKQEPTLEAIDLNEAAREVMALSSTEIQRAWITLQQEFADNLPLAIADRIQIQQVILNLLRNATDAMNTVTDRPRELIIKTERQEANQILVTVKDSGVGFTSQAAEKIFEAFHTTKTDGMGIGLSVSRSIIEAHRGRLWATKNDGPGATFSFTVPCRDESATDAEDTAIADHHSMDAA
jgi:PAS domain S-box-containing protein